MEMLNRAIEDAADFKDIMWRMQNTELPMTSASQEMQVWNTEVERKRAEKSARRHQTEAIDGRR